MPSQFAPIFAWAQGTFEVADAAALGALSHLALKALISEAYPGRNLIGADGIFPETPSSPSCAQLVEKLAPIGVPAIDLTKPAGMGKARAAGWSKKSDSKTTTTKRGAKRSAELLSASAATDRSEGTARPGSGRAKASRERGALRESLKMAVSDKSVRQDKQDAEAHATQHDRRRLNRKRTRFEGNCAICKYPVPHSASYFRFLKPSDRASVGPRARRRRLRTLGEAHGRRVDGGLARRPPALLYLQQ